MAESNSRSSHVRSNSLTGITSETLYHLANGASYVSRAMIIEIYKRARLDQKVILVSKRATRSNTIYKKRLFKDYTIYLGSLDENG